MPPLFYCFRACLILLELCAFVAMQACLLLWLSEPAFLLLLLLSHFSRVQLCATPEKAAHHIPHPWDFLGKNTGVGCHFLLQCMKVKSESEVAQSCPTLRDPMDCSLPGSSIHGIFQARVLERGAITFSGNAGDPGSIPGFGRSAGEGKGYRLQYSWTSWWLSC